MSLKQPFMPVGIPVVDAAGVMTPVFVQFLLNGWQRTNGDAGPTKPLTGSGDAAAAAAAASALAAQTAAASAQAGVVRATAAASDAQIVSLFEAEAAVSFAAPDQAAFLAQLIGD